MRLNNITQKGILLWKILYIILSIMSRIFLIYLHLKKLQLNLQFSTYNKIPYDAMKLNKVSFNTPTNFSLFEKEKNSIVLSTVKKAEHENKLLVRLFNSSNETSFNDNIKFNNKKVIRMASVKLSENEIEELDYNTKNNLGEFTPCKVKTFSFNIK